MLYRAASLPHQMGTLGGGGGGPGSASPGGGGGQAGNGTRGLLRTSSLNTKKSAPNRVCCNALLAAYARAVPTQVRPRTTTMRRLHVRVPLPQHGADAHESPS